MAVKSDHHEDLPEAALERSPPLAVHSPGGIRRALGMAGLFAALLMFLWLAIGWLDPVPSMVDVFGMTGLRIPAGVAIGGLLLAAIGFNEF